METRREENNSDALQTEEDLFGSAPPSIGFLPAPSKDAIFEAETKETTAEAPPTIMVSSAGSAPVIVLSAAQQNNQKKRKNSSETEIETKKQAKNQREKKLRAERNQKITQLERLLKEKFFLDQSVNRISWEKIFVAAAKAMGWSIPPPPRAFPLQDPNAIYKHKIKYYLEELKNKIKQKSGYKRISIDEALHFLIRNIGALEKKATPQHDALQRRISFFPANPLPPDQEQGFVFINSTSSQRR